MLLISLGDEVWVNLQLKVAEFYTQCFKSFRFDDMVALVHLLNKLNEEMMLVNLDLDT